MRLVKGHIRLFHWNDKDVLHGAYFVHRELPGAFGLGILPPPHPHPPPHYPPPHPTPSPTPTGRHRLRWSSNEKANELVMTVAVTPRLIVLLAGDGIGAISKTAV